MAWVLLGKRGAGERTRTADLLITNRSRTVPDRGRAAENRGLVSGVVADRGLWGRPPRHLLQKLQKPVSLSLPQTDARPLGGLLQWAVLRAQGELSSLGQFEVRRVIHRDLVGGGQL